MKSPRASAALKARGPRGFTLIELMVVVAIIALLLAVLLPTLTAVRRRAKLILCQQNLHQIGIGWQSYLADSKGFFLKNVLGSDNYEVNFGGKQGATATWRIKKPLNPHLRLPLKVYTKGAEVFKCPEDTGSPSALPSYFESFGNSYLTNHLLIGKPGLQVDPVDPYRSVMQSVADRMQNRLPGFPPRTITFKLNVSSVDNPGRVLLDGDSGWYNAWYFTFTPDAHVDWHHRPMHYNLGFLDGHVAFTEIRKSVSVSPNYVVIPYGDLQAAWAKRHQELDP